MKQVEESEELAKTVERPRAEREESAMLVQNCVGMHNGREGEATAEAAKKEVVKGEKKYQVILPKPPISSKLGR